MHIRIQNLTYPLADAKQELADSISQPGIVYCAHSKLLDNMEIPCVHDSSVQCSDLVECIWESTRNNLRLFSVLAHGEGD